MNKTIFLTGCILGGLSIILGAFGAHGLKPLIGVDALTTFEVGVKYQMYHALLLLILAQLSFLTAKSKKVLFVLIVVGVILFSFSIYGLATNSLTSFNFKSIGFITPIGGLFLIFAWILLAYRSYTHYN